jgi:hypothetical protein
MILEEGNMTIEVPYTNKPEDVTRLFNLLPTMQVPVEPVDAACIKSWGFSTGSSNHLLKILRKMGFLDERDKPSAVWLTYVADEKRGLVLASAIKKAYADLFDLSMCPYLEDDENIMDYLKKDVKSSPREMDLMLQTFRNLTELADFQDLMCAEGTEVASISAQNDSGLKVKVNPNLQLNLQIHIDPNMPDDKIETIFKNMRKYLLDKES